MKRRPRRGSRTALQRSLLALSITAALTACDSGTTEPQTERALVSTAVPAAPAEQVRELLQQLQDLATSDRHGEALTLAKAFRERHPGTPELEFAIGTLQAQRSDFEAAIISYERELTRDPDHVRSLLGMAMAHTELGQFDAALAAADKALLRTPGSPDARVVRIRALAGRGELEPATIESEQLARTTGRAGDWTSHAALLIQQGRLEQAREALETALDINPGLADARFRLGQLLIRLGQRAAGEELLQAHARQAGLADRIDHLQRSARMEGATAANFTALGQARLEAANPAAAEHAFRQALTRQQDFPPAVFGLTSLLLDSNRLDEASRWAVVAVMAAPEDFRSHFLLGMTRLGSRQFEAAEEAFARSRSLRNWGAEAWVHVAEAWLERDQLQRAEQALQRARELNPEQAGLAEIETRLTNSAARAGN